MGLLRGLVLVALATTCCFAATIGEYGVDTYNSFARAFGGPSIRFEGNRGKRAAVRFSEEDGDKEHGEDSFALNELKKVRHFRHKIHARSRAFRGGNHRAVVNVAGGRGGGDRQSDVQVSGSATGDPHFTGFQGQKFDFMGRPGTTFNILSDNHLTVNARFVAGPNGKSQTFMGAVGIKFGDAKLKIQECGFKMVCGYLDGNELKMGDVKVLPNGAIVRKKAHTVERIEVEIPSEGYLFKFASPKPDRWNMPHIDIHAALTKIPEDAHGILGQTARDLKAGKMMDSEGKFKPEGEDLDYAVSHLFSHDFKFNRHETSESISHVSRRLLSAAERLTYDLEIIAEAHIISGEER